MQALPDALADSVGRDSILAGWKATKLQQCPRPLRLGASEPSGGGGRAQEDGMPTLPKWTIDVQATATGSRRKLQVWARRAPNGGKADSSLAPAPAFLKRQMLASFHISSMQEAQSSTGKEAQGSAEQYKNIGQVSRASVPLAGRSSCARMWAACTQVRSAGSAQLPGRVSGSVICCVAAPSHLLNAGTGV